MKIREQLNEITLETDPKIQEHFNYMLQQIFSGYFLDKIERQIKRSIKIKEIEEGADVIAYNSEGNIYINKNEFYKLSDKKKMEYLLHEFVHILQRERRVFFLKFREVKVLTNKLNKILKKHLKQPIGVFLTGKNQNLGPGGKWEILSYLMNRSINWQALTNKGKKLFFEAVYSSGIFNLRSNFWRKVFS